MKRPLSLFFALFLSAVMIPFALYASATGQSSTYEEKDPPSEAYNLIGLPYYTKILQPGNISIFSYYLYNETAYAISLYGPYVDSSADLEILIFNKKGELVNFTSNSPGKPDFIWNFTPKTSDPYFITVSSDIHESTEAGLGILLVAEQLDIEEDEAFSLFLEGKNVTSPTLNQSMLYAYLLDVKDYQGTEVSVSVSTPSSLQAELRIYGFTSNSEKSKYDPLNTVDGGNSISYKRGEKGEDLHASLVVGLRDYERVNDTTVLICLIGVRGEGGNCEGSFEVKTPQINWERYAYHSVALIASTALLLFTGYYGEKYLR